MVNQKILTYLQKGVSRGFQVTLLKQNLIKAGFPQDQVNEAAKALKDTSKEVLPQAPAIPKQQAQASPQQPAQQQPVNKTGIKRRNIFLIYLFSMITFGIYWIYWTVSTKNEMNKLGAKIPTAWLLIVPIANIYWIYKYTEGFVGQVKKDNNTTLWFILFFFFGIIMPIIVQKELNKLAR